MPEKINRALLLAAALGVGLFVLAETKAASPLVWDQNLVEVGRMTPARLLDARVLFTITGGRVVYEAGKAM